MDRQELYNKARDGIKEQGCLAFQSLEDGGGTCMYRAANGSRCALGQLIPDELYHKAMEGNGPWLLFEKFPIVLEYLGVDNREFLGDLAMAHDDAAFNGSTTEVALSRLADVARNYGLEP